MNLDSSQVTDAATAYRGVIPPDRYHEPYMPLEELESEIAQGVVFLGYYLDGTWAAAGWAIRFYEKHGFRLVTEAEKDSLLEEYWRIAPRQIETSVVLADASFGSAPGQASAPGE